MDQATEDMVFYAFRYCLGRMTYSVSTCVDYILKHWSELSEKTRGQMVKEINEAIAQNMAGMDMDIEQWKKIVERSQS